MPPSSFSRRASAVSSSCAIRGGCGARERAWSAATAVLALTFGFAGCTATQLASSARPREMRFERRVLSNEFYGEGASFADLDRDGVNDIVSGPYWYRGPRFDERREIYEPKVYDPKGYSDSFFDFARDFDGDGWLDVLVVGFPGKEAAWFENPHVPTQRWKRHLVHPTVDNESPWFTDVTGDGVPEIVCNDHGRLAWIAPGADVREPWVVHAITAELGYGNFTHGLGVGDVDGDGRADVLTKDGWWKQPASLAGDPVWEAHPFAFAQAGGAQMLVFDVDGDGDNDVVTSLAAHGFGLTWYEHVRREGAVDFVAHPILGKTPEENAHRVCFAELHALALCDMNGDGLPDVVTGKRFWSHGQHGDPEAGNPAVLYWFELARAPDSKGRVDWIPHRIDDDSGVGTQVVAGDIDGDKRPDVVIGNKLGTFVFLQRTSAASAPISADSTRAFNLDFEDGSLAHWHAEGDAFVGQPIYRDTITGRGREASKHAGKYWIGGYEKRGDEAKGTLTSDPFPCSAPFASFLVGGGAGAKERVELWEQGAANPFFHVTGANFESMQRVVVDLGAQKGKSIYVRLVDDESGGWGHLNFDDFRFHAEKPSFERDTKIPAILPIDLPKNAGLSPADAPRAMTVPPGFHVDLIAAEPDLQQPVAFTIDTRGRIWVAEAFSYPQKRPKGQGHDTIRVFEDRDADGTFETKTTFIDNLNLVSGLEVGYGGVWVGQAPELLFIPDKNDDLVPDGPPEVLLDGWGLDDTHETLNAFTWGPDGWLYGCHGVFTHSRVGKPGTPDAQRVPINAGVWRFHPKRREFEVFAWGTSNPWGIDFDEQGNAFITACVIPHLFHVIQGGRYERQAGSHFDKYVFEDIPTIADHRHYVGNDPHGGNGRSESVGGGHAHCGAMIYQGASFPDKWRGALFMNNIHGNRVNVDTLERKGSSFVGHHGEDFLLANDAWFRGINLKYGPDGSVFLIDWYDAQACHHNDVNKWDRTNGRLYRVSYGTPAPRTVDLRAMPSAALCDLQLEPNEWFARNAQLVLAERGRDDAVRAKLEQRFHERKDTRSRLRALWTLAAMGEFEAETLSCEALRDGDETIAAWAVQLACEERAPNPPQVHELARLAATTRSAVVAVHLASAAQRVDRSIAHQILGPLVERDASVDDATLQRMLWYALEPLAARDPAFVLDVGLRGSKRIAEWTLRRLASEPETRELLLSRAVAPDSILEAKRVLEALRLALADEKRAPLPPSWPKFDALVSASGDAKARETATTLAIVFGDARSFPTLRARLVDTKASIESRRGALETLARGNDKEGVSAMLACLDVNDLRGDALRALASFDDARIAPAVLAHWPALARNEREDALATLCGRPSSALVLLQAVEQNRVARSDISAYALRTLENLRDPKVSELLARAVGVVRRTSEQNLARIAELKKTLTPAAIAGGERVHGRELFAATCSRCHTLFGAGGTLAPDLTGSNRKDLDYLLTNMVDPSAVIPKDYQVTMLWTKDERLVTGIVKKRTSSSVVLATETGNIVVDASDVAEEKLSPISTMPEGLLDPLGARDIRDLVAYLQGEAQVVRVATRDNVSALFDSKTLAGWTGDSSLWSVEGDEIVGRTTGLARNEFLKSDLELTDFRFVVEVRLVNDAGNSGIQFRTTPRANGEVEGPQADVGPGWWGKLYEENGRGLLVDNTADSAAARSVKKDAWNRYEIVAVGSRVLTSINGVVCADLDDPKLARKGVLALQLHAGDATEVRFRNLRLELDPKPELTGR